MYHRVAVAVAIVVCVGVPATAGHAGAENMPWETVAESSTTSTTPAVAAPPVGDGAGDAAVESPVAALDDTEVEAEGRVAGVAVPSALAAAVIEAPAAAQQPPCHPSYVGACVPLSEVDCDDIDAVNFQVVGLDDQGLDRDDDGIACESGAGPDVVAPQQAVVAPDVAAPMPAPAAAPVEVQAAVQQQPCDPNYSGCVPVGMGDIDCAGAGGTNLAVIGTDVYGLDADHDGIACDEESSASGGVASSQATSGASPSSGQLASTGGSLVLGGLALALLVGGMAMLNTAGYVSNPLTGRLRGGFTIVGTGRYGQETRIRIVTARRRR